MKKWLLKLSLVSDDTFTPTNSSCSSYVGTSFGYPVTKDGTFSLVGQRSTALTINGGKHTKTFVVVDARRTYKGRGSTGRRI